MPADTIPKSDINPGDIAHYRENSGYEYLVLVLPWDVELVGAVSPVHVVVLDSNDAGARSPAYGSKNWPAQMSGVFYEVVDHIDIEVDDNDYVTVEDEIFWRNALLDKYHDENEYGGADVVDEDDEEDDLDELFGDDEDGEDE